MSLKAGHLKGTPFAMSEAPFTTAADTISLLRSVLLWQICLLIVVWLFLAVPWVSLQFVIVVFPDHTHYFWLNSHLASGDFFHLLITFANSLDQMLDLIWIPIVSHFDSVPERIF